MGQFKLSSKEQNQMIEFAIAKKEVRAVELGTTDVRGCIGCVFRRTCTAKHDRICMAHNRSDGKSVYFIKATRDNGATGQESGKNVVCKK